MIILSPEDDISHFAEEFCLLRMMGQYCKLLDINYISFYSET